MVPPLADGPDGLPAGTAVDVVVVTERQGGRLAALLDRWRDLEPPPGVLAVVLSKTASAAAEAARVPHVPAASPPAEVAAAVTRALAMRWSGRLSAPFARGALGLMPEGDPDRDAARVVAAARGANLDMVREALRWYAFHYASTTGLVDRLREMRALEIPEVEVVMRTDGARTVQTLIRTASGGGALAGRLLWALICVGAVQITPEPPDLLTHERRAVTAARHHLRARQARSEDATLYDLLEVTPRAEQPEIDHNCQMLGLRYSPRRLAHLDLGDLASLPQGQWEAILSARETLCDPAEKLRYNEQLRAQLDQLRSAWAVGPNDRARAEQALARGQRALLAGEAFKAVSEMAAAARAHGDHPDYEASLAWARFRADMERGNPRAEAARRERRAAEECMAGRRPWPRGLLALALLCAADSDSDAARWHLHEALTCDPNLPAARQLLARLGK